MTGRTGVASMTPGSIKIENVQDILSILATREVSDENKQVAQKLLLDSLNAALPVTE